MRYNNYMSKIVAVVLIMTVAVNGMRAQAQEEGVNDGCISVETLQKMIHLPVVEAMDILEEKGYHLGSISDTIVDTVDYFPLRYQRTGFYNYDVPGAEILIMESLDGLSNYVQYSLGRRGECNLMQELGGSDYVFNKQKSTFTGTILVDGKIERYEFVIYQDSSLWVSCKYIDEIDGFVTPKKNAAIEKVRNAISRAVEKQNAGLFDESLSLLDSVMGYYPPMDDSVRACMDMVKRNRINHYTALLDMALSQNEMDQSLMGLPYCDTILSIDPDNERVKRVKELLEAWKSNSTVSYKTMCPNTYEMLCKALQDIVNMEIRDNVGKKKQEMKLNFNIRTDYDNETNGEIALATIDPKYGTLIPNAPRTLRLQSEIDSVAKSPLLEPVREKNVFIRTSDTVSALVRWYYSSLSVDGHNIKDSVLQQMVDSIESQYMYETLVSKTELEPDGSFKQVKVPRLPTKRIYSFGWVNKELDRQGYIEQYRDIYLMDFHTARGLSWAPSLIVPGLGTFNQDARDDVISRALPFFLFGGIGVFGLLWETKISHPRQEITDVNMNPLYLKNVGYYIAGVGLGISAAIYINELVESIGNSFKNAKRSKAIRKQLAKGPLLIDAQDVIIR